MRLQGASATPNPASCTQAVLQLLTHLTKKHSNAQVCMRTHMHGLGCVRVCARMCVCEYEKGLRGGWGRSASPRADVLMAYCLAKGANARTQSGCLAPGRMRVGLLGSMGFCKAMMVRTRIAPAGCCWLLRLKRDSHGDAACRLLQHDYCGI